MLEKYVLLSADHCVVSPVYGEEITMVMSLSDRGQGGISAQCFIWLSAAFLHVSRGLGHQIPFLLLSASSLFRPNQDLAAVVDWE